MFTLDTVVPWGRSFDEYRRMFSLTDEDLRGRILGCADGPAAFNAELTRRGGRIVSCDPLYRFDAGQIRSRIAATADEVLDQTRQNAAEFVWGEAIPSVEALGTLRLSSMEMFLDDYAERGRSRSRFVAAALPALPFADAAFDLAVCSHFLFLYSAHLSQAVHFEGLRELCRVAREVRVFPLLALGGTRSPWLDPVAGALREAGLDVSVVPVAYEFQRGGDEMLRVVSG